MSIGILVGSLLTMLILGECGTLLWVHFLNPTLPAFAQATWLQPSLVWASTPIGFVSAVVLPALVAVGCLLFICIEESEGE